MKYRGLESFCPFLFTKRIHTSYIQNAAKGYNCLVDSMITQEQVRCGHFADNKLFTMVVFPQAFLSATAEVDL